MVDILHISVASDPFLPKPVIVVGVTWRESAILYEEYLYTEKHYGYPYQECRKDYCEQDIHRCQSFPLQM